jgi:hypothetical protein
MIVKIKKPLEPGNVVGSEKQRKILKDLEKLRKIWR